MSDKVWGITLLLKLDFLDYDSSPQPVPESPHELSAIFGLNIVKGPGKTVKSAQMLNCLM